MRVLDLFSGIGGFSLGLERAGMRTVAFCEIDPYCRAVIARHWPGVPIFGDIREVTANAVRDALRHEPGRWHGPSGTSAAELGPDVLCGGFPCQDISVAGKGAGLAGARSGLWSEYARLIGELRPRYVIVENVSALLARGLERVLGDLAALGFDAEWHCIPAAYVGAPHRRDRIWIVAHTDIDTWRQGRPSDRAEGSRRRHADRSGEFPHLADADQQGPQGRHGAELRERAGERTARPSSPHAHADSEPTQRTPKSWSECDQWESEPDVGRVAHGVPSRVDRLRALGNAVVPQVVEVIGRAIMRHAT